MSEQPYHTELVFWHFLGVKASLELAHVKNNKKNGIKIFGIAYVVFVVSDDLLTIAYC